MHGRPRFFLRIACALSDGIGDALELYSFFSSLEYKHVNAPEAHMYLSRQLYEEALHVQLYLTLLDTYVPDPAARHRAFAAIDTISSIRKKAEFCTRWIDSELEADVTLMLEEAVDCETQFAKDLLGGGVGGLSVQDVRGYLEFCADQRLARLGMRRLYGTKNPLSFMDLQDVQEITNLFERRVSSYQVGGERRRRVRRGVLAATCASHDQIVRRRSLATAA